MGSFRHVLFLFPFFCFGSIDPNPEEEALFLNRIADFWEEEEFKLAKVQIEEFLSLYPESAYTASLHGSLGDLYLKEGNPSSALDSYAKIDDPEIIHGIFLNKLLCLSKLQWHGTIVDECEAYLRTKPESENTDIVTHYLAMGLYELSLNTEGERSILFAEKAKPHFEMLYKTALKDEIIESFAHLLSILKKNEEGASLYLELAETKSQTFLLNAAFLQSKFDKDLGLKTLDEMIQKTQSPDAYFARLSLLFELDRFEEIKESKELFLSNVSPSKLPETHLLLGRSFYALENFEEACLQLGSFTAASDKENESLYSALQLLIRGSVAAEDLSLLNVGLTKLELLYPEDEALFEAKFSKALLLKKQDRVEEALRELSLLEQRPEVLLEEISIYDKMGSWKKGREMAFSFLSTYPNHEQMPLAGRFLIAASTEMANAFEEGRKELISDLERLLKKEFIPLETKLFWQYLLGKTHFILKNTVEADKLLHRAIKDPSFPNDSLADAYLVLSLCNQHNLETFISYGELALRAGAPEKAFLHISLFNAYLEKDPEKAEEHLFKGFKEKGVINEHNLLWLGKRLIQKHKGEEAIEVLSPLKGEEGLLELSKAYLSLSEFDKAIAILKTVPPTDEAKLLLGKAYVGIGEKKPAKELFDSVYKEPSFLRTAIGAAASLESARLDYSEGTVPSVQVLAKLKNLILQKTIGNEPIYLEASLDYINLQTTRPEEEEREEVEGLLRKRISLLEKGKKSFLRADDLLSKEYHAGRKHSKSLDAIFSGYMNLFDAEIDSSKSLLESDPEKQKELQDKAKEIFEAIVQANVHPDLVARANQCLNP